MCVVQRSTLLTKLAAVARLEVQNRRSSDKQNYFRNVNWAVTHFLMFFQLLYIVIVNAGIIKQLFSGSSKQLQKLLFLCFV